MYVIIHTYIKIIEAIYTCMILEDSGALTNVMYLLLYTLSYLIYIQIIHPLSPLSPLSPAPNKHVVCLFTTQQSWRENQVSLRSQGLAKTKQLRAFCTRAWGKKKTEVKKPEYILLNILCLK